MAANPLTPFSPMPPMTFPPMPQVPSTEELTKSMRGAIEATIIDVMNNPNSELGAVIKKHVAESMECKELMEKLSKKVHNHMHNIEDKDDEKSDLEVLFCEIVDHQKHIMKGKSILEVENEIRDKHKDLNPEETRVLSCLLRSDGPVRLASITGMSIDAFIETMRHLGKRFKS